MTRGLQFILWGCILSSTILPLRAQQARISVSADSVFVGERFELGVVVEHGSDGIVAFPKVPDGDPEAGPLLSFGDAEVLSSRRLPPRLNGSTRVDSFVYEVVTFALDQAVVGPVIIDLMAAGDTSIVRSSTVTLPVRSTLSETETALQPPGAPMSFPNPLWTWIALIVGAVFGLAILVWFWRRSRKETGRGRPRLAPYPEATSRLGALTIPGDESAIKPFYVELSDLLRTYVSRTLDVSALELTTRELTNALSFDARVPETALKDIRGTLRVADLVKFADLRPDDEAHKTAIGKANEAVELIEAVVHPPVADENDENTSTTSAIDQG